MEFDPITAANLLTYAPLALAALALFIVCIWYNRLVALVNGKNDEMHYVAFEVVAGVFGVLVVGACIPTLGLMAALQFFILFAAAGLPMTIGYIQRHYLRIQNDRALLRQSAEDKFNGGQTED